MDVNAERDGLLHVKDMGETFTPSAGEVVATKDIIQARVKFVDPVTGKLGLSLVEVRALWGHQWVQEGVARGADDAS